MAWLTVAGSLWKQPRARDVDVDVESRKLGRSRQWLETLARHSPVVRSAAVPLLTVLRTLCQGLGVVRVCLHDASHSMSVSVLLDPTAGMTGSAGDARVLPLITSGCVLAKYRLPGPVVWTAPAPFCGPSSRSSSSKCRCPSDSDSPARCARVPEGRLVCGLWVCIFSGVFSTDSCLVFRNASRCRERVDTGSDCAESMQFLIQCAIRNLVGERSCARRVPGKGPVYCLLSTVLSGRQPPAARFSSHPPTGLRHIHGSPSPSSLASPRQMRHGLTLLSSSAYLILHRIVASRTMAIRP